MRFPRSIAQHDEREAGTRHQTFLRRRDRDVDSPLVEREGHAADRRHAVDEREHAARARDRATPPQHRSRRRWMCRNRRRRRRGSPDVRSSSASTSSGSTLAFPVGRDAMHDEPVRLGELRPHLAELAVAAHRDLVARTRRDCRSPPPAPRAPSCARAARAARVPKTGPSSSIIAASSARELRRAMMNHRPRTGARARAQARASGPAS